MSSFFTLPASQKKRKRPQAPGDAPAKSGKPTRRRETRDESISGSDISDDDAAEDDFSGSESEDEELKNEDPAAKRIRLAEQYLANTQKEVLELGGFDAADVDAELMRERMGERLKEDTAESKGKLYRFIADEFDWSGAQHDQFRTDTKGVNGVDRISMSILEDDGGLGVALRTKVHELDGEVVRNGSEEVLAVSRVPLHVVDGGTVVVELASRVESLCLEGEIARQVPQVHDLVLTTREELAFSERVPFESKAFAGVSSERRLRPGGVVCWNGRVLRAVPNVDIVVGRESRNDVRVLWLVTGLVDLAGVRDLLHN
jgi:hypothetical protein